MNAALLRVLLTAAARGAARGTLFEIVETAERLLALVKPLLAPDGTDASTRPADPQAP